MRRTRAVPKVPAAHHCSTARGAALATLWGSASRVTSAVHRYTWAGTRLLTTFSLYFLEAVNRYPYLPPRLHACCSLRHDVVGGASWLPPALMRLRHDPPTPPQVGRRAARPAALPPGPVHAPGAGHGHDRKRELHWPAVHHL